MKGRAVIALLVLALLAFITTAAWAVQEGEAQGPKLVPTIVSWNPEFPYPGQTVQFTLKYENVGTAPALKDTKVVYRIEAEAGEEPFDLKEETEILLPADLQPGASNTVTDTFWAPVEEDTYALTAILSADDAEVPSDKKTMVVESALPPGVAQLFAGLGVFVAVMAIMALGTEVVLEPIKVFFGMKQKVSALEALDELKRELPGQLAGLGVDAKQVEAVQAIFGNLQTTLQPVQDINQAVAAIRAGLFGDALTIIEDISALPSGTVQKTLDDLKAKAKDAVRSGFATLRENLNLSGTIAKSIESLIETNLIAAIDAITLQDLNKDSLLAKGTLLHTLEQIQHALKDPQWAVDWLNLQADTVLAGAHRKAVALLDDTIRPTLEGLGIPAGHVDTFHDDVKRKLDQAARFGQHKAETYTDAVRELLKAVEARRNETQSWWRKLWRRLRKGDKLGGAFEAVETRAIKAIKAEESNLGDVDPKSMALIDSMAPTSVAAVTLKLDDLHRDQETTRIRNIRILSIIVGIILAFMLKIDAAVYLNYAIPGIESRINGIVDLHEACKVIPEGLTVGIILTGLAASAGSKFWRDLLGRLQETRGQAEEAARLVRKVKGMADTVSGQD